MRSVLGELALNEAPRVFLVLDAPFVGAGCAGNGQDDIELDAAFDSRPREGGSSAVAMVRDSRFQAIVLAPANVVRRLMTRCSERTFQFEDIDHDLRYTFCEGRVFRQVAAPLNL